MVEVYGQSKNEYVFQFAYESGHDSLTCYLGNQTSFVFLDRKEKPKSGVPEFFRAAKGTEVLDTGVFLNDRSFFIKLSNNYCLVFKLYGVHGNVILFEEDEPQTMIRKNLQNDWLYPPSGYHQHLDQSYEAFLQAVNNTGSAEKAVRKIFPTFTRDFVYHLESNGLSKLQPIDQWQLVSDLLDYLENPVFYIHYCKPEKKFDPGIRLSFFNGPDVMETHHSVLPALKHFGSLYLKKADFVFKKQSLLDYWKKDVARLKKRVNKSYDNLQKLVEGYDYKTIADIIMANLHRLKKGLESTELYDFYNDRTITIKFKKSMTPQENAERYYKKSKNQAIELETLEQNLEKDKEKLANAEAMMESVEAENDHKQLNKLYKHTFETGKKQSPKQELRNKFKHFEFSGFDIYVGKGAKNNDLLTFQFANKNDLWLHARERSGSHVIVRNPGVKDFPNGVIEKAASLAAYFSKGKGEAMCPVVMTRKKYVWKPKGSDPGQVHYKFEEVIMAEPEKD